MDPTEIGTNLALRLAEVQSERIARALAGRDGPKLEEAASRFLLAMINPDDRARVRSLICGAKMPE